ncbi:sialidase family protein [Novipirellula sp. SH528]|uniref:sialidase family protein n=1 Tax=Novipirellula sp. SH528 TaxID=3454466 RepID=UPI003FA10F4E
MKMFIAIARICLVTTIFAVLPGWGGTAAIAEDVLFSTSFEYGKDAVFPTIQDGPVRIQSTGTASISSKFARTGKQCLHLLGDENNSITFVIPADMQPVKGIRFHAERWTSKDPFSFSVEAHQGGKWCEVSKIDRIVTVGARFLSHIQLAIPGEDKVDAIRFSVTAAPIAGVLIDDLSLLASAPQRPSSIPSDVMPSELLKLIEDQPLFVSGQNDTHTFRIPAIATAVNGDLIAACDARRKGSADLIGQRTIDIVFRRSTDNGKTWSAMEVLDPYEDGGCSDPSLIVDDTTGDIFCFYNYMVADKSSKEYRFVVQKSSDHGVTWAAPIDFTDQVAGPELKEAFKFITSGRGIQTRAGLLVHNYVEVGKGVTLFASSDHGMTWKTIGKVSPGDESKVVELPDGTLMVNSRIGPGKRFVHRSSDGGKNWDSVSDFSLPDPRCNACIIQYTAKRDGYSKDRLVFVNAASNSGRENLAVRISYDGGWTWSDGKVIDPGPSAYSEITVLKDGSFGVLYEPGYDEVRFVRFTLEDLTDGEDRLIKPYAAVGND